MIACAKKSLDERGYGMASAPLMSGYQDIHKCLEEELSEFHGTDKTIVYPSGYQANLGWFATMFGKGDVIISDQFNHASIIDGIKLCKADKKIYKHMNNKDLERKLQATQHYEKRCVVTEGVFSMDADIVDLKEVVRLCKKYKAVLFLDDCHGVGVIGKTGRGTPEYNDVPMSEIDAYIATMGKGLSGGGGGYITGSYPIITWLKQRSRTYIFSNALPPTTASCSREAIRILIANPNWFDEHKEKAHRFRNGMRKEGFEIMGNDDCPICPVFVKDELLCREVELELLRRGIYTIAVGCPVMEIGTARIRVIITMGHTDAMIDKAIKTFKAVADDLGYWEQFNTYDQRMKSKLVRYKIVSWLKGWFVPQDV